MTLVERDSADTTGRRLGPPQHFWEDFEVGDVIESAGITVAESHLVTWAGLTGDIVQFHLNEEYAATTPFGRRVAHGPFTLSSALGLMTQTGYFTQVVAWLGLDEVRAAAPVFIGDTIHAVATVTVARTTSKPATGIWSLDYQVRNQRDETAMTFRSSFMVARRPA